ncbi:MAG: translocation/assembly module TamB domain-containing protein, partial [Cyclobacteriaceae bacterium]|nr:translocation/assembly module TamB domain-containing protein [Cyclobacteriaceae bacterium]
YGLVQKSFNILEGSNIIWAGDPDDARMNLIASFILRTSSSGLVAAETAGITDEEMNQYRKTLPYEVKILITGTFQQPELDFEINLVDENRAAYPLVLTKLNRINGEGYESQLTQQVFGLLTIGSFIPEQTFDSGSGSYSTALASTAAANSLNGILAGEFNKLSGKYLKGVDLDIGLQSYSQMSSGSTTTQTTMDVKFSKNLFNDRVTLEAQTSFDVGGDKYPDPEGDPYSNVQSDFAIKYDLTRKGDYKLKAFNKSSYDIIYKDIRSTGIAIIFVREFDQLSEIRKKRKVDKKEEE